MNKRDSKLIVLQFNEYINRQDIESLANLLAQNYQFVDSNNDVHRGKEANVKGWRITKDRRGTNERKIYWSAWSNS